MNLRDLAAAELAWVIAREETYKLDGMTIPEPIRRLKALALTIQDTQDPGSSAHLALAGAVLDVASRLKVSFTVANTDEAAIVALAEIEKRAANGDAVRDVIAKCDAALKDGAGVLLGMSKELGGLFIAGPGAGQPVVLDSGIIATGPVSTVAPSRAVEVGSPVILLRHGLLLKQRKTGHRALFSEVKADEFVYQWVSVDGKQSTDATAVNPCDWRSDTWEVCAETIYVAPIAPTPTHSPTPSATADGSVIKAALPGGATVEGKPTEAASTSGLIYDWNPTAEDMTKSAKDLGAAMVKAGVAVEVNVPSLVAKFKTEKGAQASKRPAMAFYHWAVAALKGS